MQETIRDATENRDRVARMQRAEIRPEVERATARAALVEALGEYFAQLGDRQPDPICEAYRLILSATDKARVELLSRGQPAVRAERWARRQRRRKLRSMVYRIS